MRPSKRTDILSAAARVVQRDGVAALTYDSIAAESGITKGGLVYHFPSRDELILALHEHLAAQWEDGMTAAASKTADEATALERLQGYVRAAMSSATRAELLFLLEGATHDDHIAPWKAVLERWTPPVPADTDDSEAVDLFIARLAADGLWVYESLSAEPLDPSLREHVADVIARRIASDRTR